MVEYPKKKLIVLAGPTAVGKTALSIKLAHAIGGAVISADSMQVYRGMDIGSGKIRPEEREDIPHYLVDVLEPEEEFHVVRFQQMAKEALAKIYDAGQIPILVGGTGFYIQALLYDIDFTEQANDPALRARYEEIARKEGPAALHSMLADIDPVSAAAIHENNVKRTIRALEFYDASGVTISSHNEQERQKESPYAFCYFVLTDERERIYACIDKRVDCMLDDGLVAEVEALRKRGIPRDAVSMQGLGYKELRAYLDGACDYEDAVRVIKRDTRHFAKRQLTWFRRERDVIWIDKADYGRDEERILARMLEILMERGIL